jgi:peptidyl-prolyl cis-trans isomerase D
MAVLEKIRSRAGLLVGIIALALFSFVVQGLFDPQNSIFGGKANKIGEINGNSVPGQEFQQKLSELEEQYKQNQGKTAVDENTRQQLINQVWNEYLDKYLFDEQIDDAGIAVPEDELFDMVQGDNINEQVKGIPIFQDSITKQFDRKLVIRFLKNQLSEENDPDGKYRKSWADFEKSLIQQRRKAKYNNLIKKALYVTNAQAKSDFADKNNQVMYRLVAKKYDAISDSTIKVTDEEMKKYYDEHRYEFEQLDESRKLEYVVFVVNASAEDRDELVKSMEKLKPEFQTATNDTAFVNANAAEAFEEKSVKRGSLAPQIDSSIFAGSPGSVYGPYTDGEQIKLVKLRGFKAASDSVRARHILISTKEGMDPAKAMAKADSLKNVIKAGKSDFAILAIQFSEDPGSKVKGGDLGWFTAGQMVPEFNDACFNGNVGDFVVVKTQFGAHLINIQEKTKPSNKAQVAFLVKNVEPSTKTIDELYAQANDFAVNAQNYDSFKKLADQKNYFIVKFPNLRPNDRQVNDLANSRELVQWSYNPDRELKEVSTVFDFDNKYVVAVLTGIKDKGFPSFDQVKDDVEPLAKKEKKADKFSTEFEAAIKTSKTIDDLGAKLKLTAEPRQTMTFGAYSAPVHGFEPKLIGTVVTGKLNVISKPVRGLQGVYVYSVDSIPAATPIPKDLKEQKKTISSSAQSRVEMGVYNALLKKGNVDDRRYRFF